MILVINNIRFLQALEDVNLPHRPILQDILYYMDRIFTVIFFIEMLIKWLALGFQKYFTNAWCWLDFIIVMVIYCINITLYYSWTNSFFTDVKATVIFLTIKLSQDTCNRFKSVVLFKGLINIFEAEEIK